MPAISAASPSIDLFTFSSLALNKTSETLRSLICLPSVTSDALRLTALSIVRWFYWFTPQRRREKGNCEQEFDRGGAI